MAKTTRQSGVRVLPIDNPCSIDYIVLPHGRDIDCYDKAMLSPQDIFKGLLDGSEPFLRRKGHLRLVVDNTKENKRNGN